MQICMCETRNIPHQHNGAVVPEPESQRKNPENVHIFSTRFLIWGFVCSIKMEVFV